MELMKSTGSVPENVIECVRDEQEICVIEDQEILMTNEQEIFVTDEHEILETDDLLLYAVRLIACRALFLFSVLIG